MAEHAEHKTVSISKHKLQNIINTKVTEVSVQQVRISYLKTLAPDPEHLSSSLGSLTLAVW